MARADFTDQTLGVSHKLSGAVGLQGIENVDQVVRYGGLLVAGGFGGANVHAAIDQGRIHADDFTGLAALGQYSGQRQSSIGFAGCGGASNGNAGQGRGGSSQDGKGANVQTKQRLPSQALRSAGHAMAAHQRA